MNKWINSVAVLIEETNRTLCWPNDINNLDQLEYLKQLNHSGLFIVSNPSIAHKGIHHRRVKILFLSEWKDSNLLKANRRDNLMLIFLRSFCHLFEVLVLTNAKKEVLLFLGRHIYIIFCFFSFWPSEKKLLANGHILFTGFLFYYSRLFQTPTSRIIFPFNVIFQRQDFTPNLSTELHISKENLRLDGLMDWWMKIRRLNRE